jgi:hypothetical protein
MPIYYYHRERERERERERKIYHDKNYYKDQYVAKS